MVTGETYPRGARGRGGEERIADSTVGSGDKEGEGGECSDYINEERTIEIEDSLTLAELDKVVKRRRM